MDNVTFPFCHLYPMDRFLLFCHNQRPSYELDFIIEEPLMTYLQKKFHIALCRPARYDYFLITTQDTPPVFSFFEKENGGFD